jgi:hypothetical protein
MLRVLLLITVLLVKVVQLIKVLKREVRFFDVTKRFYF